MPSGPVTQTSLAELRAGDRMRLEVAGRPEVDIVELTQVFLSQQS